MCLRYLEKSAEAAQLLLEPKCQNAAFTATDLHSRYELDDVTQASAWSHKLAPTATHYHMQSKLGVLALGVLALGVLPCDFCTRQVTAWFPAGCLP